MVFIKIDEVNTKGLEVTRAISTKYPRIKLVWMAYSKSYAMAAFEEGINSFMLLPLNRDKLEVVIKRLGHVNTCIKEISSKFY